VTGRGSTTGLRRFVPGSADGQPAAGVPAVADVLRGARADPGAAAGQPERQPAVEEHCEFCATPISGDHGHVADLEGTSLMCACRACYLLFTHSGAATEQWPEEKTGTVRLASDGRTGPGRGRYIAIPDRYRSDAARPLSLAEWDSLEIPVALAFFLRTSGGEGVTAFYPSPAGVTQCELNLEAWAQITADHPLLATAVPDVEAILISRGRQHEPGQPAAEGGPGPAGPADQPGVEAFLVPVDACYQLAGRMRLQWRGFDGGAEARQSIADFLGRVRQRSRDIGTESRRG
jgi:Family of unknown function (DUF5947)